MDLKKWSKDYEWVKKFMNEISQNSSSSKKIETNERNSVKVVTFIRVNRRKTIFQKIIMTDIVFV